MKLMPFGAGLFPLYIETLEEDGLPVPEEHFEAFMVVV
jgi:predicted RNase H-like HicB family nuclease